MRAATLILILVFLAAPLYSAPPQQTAEGQTLHVVVNKSVVVNVQAPIQRLLTSNPAVIETVVTTPSQIVVSGKAAGVSSMIIWDGPDHSQLLDVVVEPDVSAFRAAIERAYPNQSVGVETSDSRLILSGAVTSQRIIDDLVKMAGLYSPQVVNLLNLGDVHARQMMLEVKFAEVDRTKISQFGINVLSTSAANTPGALSTQQFGAPSLQSAGIGGASTQRGSASFNVPDLLNVFLFRPDLNLAATIKDLEQKALLQILAEPNLMALNGQQASFLAGGEFPFPVVQSGQSAGAVTVQFRPFGVRLDFKGTIGDDNIIRLHVVPEVSALDFSNSVSISGFVIPALSTRKAETEIELKDGQSFGIAGLMDHRAVAQMNKLPGLGDIPILGQLFRSKLVNRSNTELVVIVTPRIVDPVKTTAAPQPPTNAMPFLDSPSFDKGIPGNKNLKTPRQQD